MQATIDKLKEKKILIWGYGREGRSTEKLIRGYCAPAALDIYEGPREGVHEENYDYVFVSPGIPFEEDAPAYDNRKSSFSRSTGGRPSASPGPKESPPRPRCWQQR